MSNFPNQVEKVIREGYEFKFGEYISRGFEIAKKEIGLNAGFFIVFFLAIMLLNFIPLVGSLANSLIVTPCLLAGFYLVTRKVDDDEPRTFGDYFKGFDYLSPLLVVALIQIGIIIALLIPIGVLIFIFQDVFIGGEGLSVGGVLAFLGLMVPMIYLTISWMFVPYLVVFYDMKAWEAMEASRKIITKKWFMFFFFGIVVGIIGMLGVLGLVLAALFTFPAAISMNFAAFRDIVGLPADRESDILDHLIEEV